LVVASQVREREKNKFALIVAWKQKIVDFAEEQEENSVEIAEATEVLTMERKISWERVVIRDSDVQLQTEWLVVGQMYHKEHLPKLTKERAYQEVLAIDNNYGSKYISTRRRRYISTR
jgi:hypothetical protein